MKILIILGLFVLSGCLSPEAMQVLEGLDYACVSVEGDGYFTDSEANGRGIKVPEGVQITPSLIEDLCN